jgi:putative adenylate-forming enzyme
MLPSFPPQAPTGHHVMRIGAVAHVLGAYAAARWRTRRLTGRDAIAVYQRRRLNRLLHHAARHLHYYRGYAGRPFEQWPLIDKAELLAHFAQMNRPGLTLEAVKTVLARGGDRLAGHLVGMSTGTSGNRGYYVISQAERFVWLGTLLAKALPDALWTQHRVALALPAFSGLYKSAAAGSRIALEFFDLAAGPESWVDALREFSPDTIVAPPKALRWLAERGALGGANIFSGAEVLDPLDRRVIEAATGTRVREIYMATEGLFGVSCRHGVLHLAEDVVHFDFVHPDAGTQLVCPIVTDFTRRAQGMIRYRMNDLLELDPAPCPCGSALQAVRRIEGRSDDAFLLLDQTGEQRLVTPDVLRNAVVDADPAILDFRVIQTGQSQIVVQLPAGPANGLDGAVGTRVRESLAAALARRNLYADIVIRRGIKADYTRKLRRVQRQWSPAREPV